MECSETTTTPPRCSQYVASLQSSPLYFKAKTAKGISQQILTRWNSETRFNWKQMQISRVEGSNPDQDGRK